MKLATPFYILLIVAFIFLSVSLIIADLNTNYPEAGNVSTGFSNKYNNLSFVDTKASDISSALGKVGEPTGGWKIFEAIVAIPLAIITTIINLIAAIPILGFILAGIATEIGVPPAVANFGMVAILVAVIIMLIKFYKGSAPI